MTNAEREQHDIDEAAAVRRLLGEPPMQRAIQALAESYFYEFRHTTAESAAVELWRKVQVLDDLLTQFDKVLGAGKHAEAIRKERERREEAQKPRPRK